MLERLTRAELSEATQVRVNALENRVVMVTGATGGLGRAVSYDAAKQGATLILLAKDEARLDQLYDEIRELGAPEPLIIKVDLATLGESHVAEIVRGVEQHFGRLDALLHAAGQLGALRPLEQYPPNLWREVLSVNLGSAFMLTQQLLVLMDRGSDASIVWVDAQSTLGAGAYWGAYGVAAASIRALAEAWAGELENTSKVRCSLVYPGPLRTSLRAAAFPAQDPSQLQDPKDVAPWISYLLSAHSRSICSKFVDLSL